MMKKDFKYIIKKVIIGVLIALILMMIKSCNVSALANDQVFSNLNISEEGNFYSLNSASTHDNRGYSISYNSSHYYAMPSNSSYTLGTYGGAITQCGFGFVQGHKYYVSFSYVVPDEDYDLSPSYSSYTKKLGISDSNTFANSFNYDKLLLGLVYNMQNLSSPFGSVIGTYSFIFTAPSSGSCLTSVYSSQNHDLTANLHGYVGYTYSDLGTNSLTESEMDSILQNNLSSLQNQLAYITTNISAIQSSITSGNSGINNNIDSTRTIILNQLGQVGATIEDTTQDIIDNQNSVKNAIINNQNQNTENIINSINEQFESCNIGTLTVNNYNKFLRLNSKYALGEFGSIKTYANKPVNISWDYNPNNTSGMFYYVIGPQPLTSSDISNSGIASSSIYQNCTIKYTDTGETVGGSYPQRVFLFDKITITCPTDGYLSLVAYQNSGSSSGYRNFGYGGQYYDINISNVEVCVNRLDNLNNNISNVNQGIDDLNNTITDSSIPSDSSSQINNITNTISANQNNTIVQLATFIPQTLQVILNGFNNQCMGGYSLGTLFGTELVIPCINPVDYLGSFLWGVIDSILCLCYLIPFCKFLVNKYNDLTSLKNLRWE